MENNKETYTKANLSKDAMFWIFGVEMGMIDCSIKTMDDLEKYIDDSYTKEQIQEIEYNYCNS